MPHFRQLQSCWYRLLQFFGMELGQSVPRMLASLVWVSKPASYYASLFPHVRFDRLGWRDAIRIPLQIGWLILMQLLPRRDTQKGGGRRTFGALRPFFSRFFKWERGVSHFMAGNAGRLLQVESLTEVYIKRHFWDLPTVRYATYGVALLLGFLCVTTPFNTTSQLVFVTLLFGTALLIRRTKGHVFTLLLMVLSVVASSRYLWWRVTSTLNWDNSFDLGWGILLLIAELYTWLILLFGYVQTAWPLKRLPLMMPPNIDSWPSVDVFIPTYNEPMKVVRATVYAAMEMDWPKDKLHIHLLDDGRRDAFRNFAEQAGINYIARSSNEHAKAGNLNHAMTKTQAEYICIFDCDHIPTRSFLQLCMGWFIQDPKLALVQTPHHFYSADPFERNLGLFRSSPNEGELFYGLIQDGNDLWNATFFCGSCAIIRRAPLELVGGIAVETVTEDAHTALKLQRLGYNSAYISIPQAAGLATESLSAHIGQRIRWARGMAQIFRLDNPFQGKGLNWTQRLCYSNAMLHFFNGIPRIIFLTAPMAFLLFHAYVIYAPAMSVALYVLPHMAHATVTNSRTQGKFRNSFWAEVYETVLAWYIARPTLIALIDPHKGKFNVTAKGGAVEHQYFDWMISLPYLTLIGLNISGAVVGCWLIYSGPADEVPTVLLNLFWVAYNLFILCAAAAVALETKQVRVSHRVEMRLAAILHLNNGKRIRCETVDFSEGGIAIEPVVMPDLVKEEAVAISLWRGDEEFAFPARVVAVVRTQIRLQWELQTQEQESALLQCTFGRADAWVEWARGRPSDRPLQSLANVLSVGLLGGRRMVNQLLIWMPPSMARDLSCFGDLNRLQSYIRLYCRRFFCPRAPMEFAKNALIFLSCSKHYADFRFTFLRSDLFRHHTGLSTCATY